MEAERKRGVSPMPLGMKEEKDDKEEKEDDEEKDEKNEKNEKEEKEEKEDDRDEEMEVEEESDTDSVDGPADDNDKDSEKPSKELKDPRESRESRENRDPRARSSPSLLNSLSHSSPLTHNASQDRIVRTNGTALLKAPFKVGQKVLVDGGKSLLWDARVVELRAGTD